MAEEADVNALREWLQKQPHLPQTLEDRFLARYLICCDNSLEKTKTCMELFFTIRAESPEIFSNRDPDKPEVQTVLRYMDVLPLDYFTPEGYSCTLFRLADLNPENFNFANLLKGVFMIADLQIRSELDIVPGLVCIVDATGWSLGHLVRLQLTTVKKLIHYCEDSTPVKVKQIHIINASAILDKLMALIRPFMTAETLSMFRIHAAGSDTLNQFVPQAVLPKEYGGNAGPLKNNKDRAMSKIHANRDWFRKDEWMTNESKRIGRRSEFARQKMDGSFRSLSID